MKKYEKDFTNTDWNVKSWLDFESKVFTDAYTNALCKNINYKRNGS